MDEQTKIYSLFWLGTCMMIVLVLCLLLLAVYYQTHLNKIKIREAHELLMATLDGETTERKRIAADLHDGVSNELTSIKTFLSIIVNTDDDSTWVEIFNDIKTGIENVAENTRRISYKLMPPLIESRGLAAALADNFERLSKITDKTFMLENVDNPLMPPSIAYEIFRVIQEFTGNILKHSTAKQCHVKISESGADIFIEIMDDGGRYSFYDQLNASGGAGLKNISSRLKILDAALKQEENEMGNKFIITLPKLW